MKSKRGSPLAKNLGFSLIELMLGSAILTFALCAMGSGLIGLTSLSDVTREKTVARNDVKRVIEQISDTSFSTITSTDWSAWTANNGGDSLDQEQMNVTYANPAPELLEVTVTVTWRTRGRPMTLSLVTLRTLN